MNSQPGTLHSKPLTPNPDSIPGGDWLDENGGGGVIGEGES